MPKLALLFAVVVMGCSGGSTQRDSGTEPPPRTDAEQPDAASTLPDAAPVLPDVGPPQPGDDAGSGPRDALPAFCADYGPGLGAGMPSTRVYYDGDGRLAYRADDEGNRVPDFSAAGYHHGERDLPDLGEVKRLGPDADNTDDTVRLQAALDEIGKRSLDQHGHRGALVLEPGSYEIAGTLRVRSAGVVLRGSGDGSAEATNTILVAVGDTPHQRSVVTVGAGSNSAWRAPVAGTETEITTSRVLVGARSFSVAQPEKLHVGARVMVHHPSTQAWINALNGGGATVAWIPGELDVVYLRRIVAIDADTITLDVPVFNHLDKSLAQSRVFEVDDASFAREVGVEHLRVDITTAGGEDENHAWNAIEVIGAEDAWVRNVTALHFGYAGVKVQQSNRVTVTNARALEPVSKVEGGRRYNFAADPHAQQVLFVDCEAGSGRHAFVSNGTSSVSGVVFLRSTSRDARTSSEGHRRWSQGLLYDRIKELAPATNRVVGLYNRGDYGTQHGWAAAHSVLWGYDTGGKEAVLQKPPTAQNYAIGTIGTVTADGPFAGGPGFVENTGMAPTPTSLYEAQLCDRLANGGALDRQWSR